MPFCPQKRELEIANSHLILRKFIQLLFELRPFTQNKYPAFLQNRTRFLREFPYGKESPCDRDVHIDSADLFKPAFDDFILPTKKYADIIIPRGGDNHVAIDLIVQHICTKLGQHDLCKIYPNLYVIQSTFQVIII